MTFEGKVLENNRTLYYYNVHHLGMISLSLRLRGGYDNNIKDLDENEIIEKIPCYDKKYQNIFNI